MNKNKKTKKNKNRKAVLIFRILGYWGTGARIFIKVTPHNLREDGFWKRKKDIEKENRT